MYLVEAVDRINNIKWDTVGKNVSREQANFGYEFLRRLARFFMDESLKPIKPIAANIARLLGDNEKEVVISDYCNPEAYEFLGEDIYKINIIKYYIQLARYSDINPDVIKYLNVYEPLIKLLEKGGIFSLRLNELDIKMVANYPLNNWYERFVVKEPIEIDY